MNTLFQGCRELGQSIKQERSNAASTAIGLNTAINVTKAYEINEQTVNGIYLNTVVKGLEPDPAQVTTLEGIAQQCPYAGGTAVFRARSLVATASDTDFDALEDCSTGSEGLAIPNNGEDVQSLTAFSVFPNPASDKFSVRLKEPLEYGAELWVTDLSGKKVSVHPLAAKERSFEFSSEKLVNGTYFLRLVEDNKEVSSGKLVIIK